VNLSQGIEKSRNGRLFDIMCNLVDGRMTSGTRHMRSTVHVTGANMPRWSSILGTASSGSTIKRFTPVVIAVVCPQQQDFGIHPS
jgi:hypothetical protein